jgi:hypothetical protein
MENVFLAPTANRALQSGMEVGIQETYDRLDELLKK